MSVQIRVLRAMLLGAVLALAAVPIGAWAQTTGPTTSGQTTTSGQLTPRDQKIAQALFEAQTQNTGTNATNASKPLTLDQITAMKRHEGWGEIFKDMKAKGLLTQKNLGQVVKDFEKHHPELAKAGKTDKPDKVDKPTKPDHMDKPERPEKPGR